MFIQEKKRVRKQEFIPECLRSIKRKVRFMELTLKDKGCNVCVSRIPPEVDKLRVFINGVPIGTHSPSFDSIVHSSPFYNIRSYVYWKTVTGIRHQLHQGLAYYGHRIYELIKLLYQTCAAVKWGFVYREHNSPHPSFDFHSPWYEIFWNSIRFKSETISCTWWIILVQNLQCVQIEIFGKWGCMISVYFHSSIIGQA